MPLNLKRRGMEIARRLAAEVVAEGAEIAREEVVDLMRTAEPSGYRDPETGAVASAPGEPPAYGKGVYAASWQTSPVEVEGNRVSARAFTDLVDPKTGRNVGIGLEYGDFNNLPRPHARVATVRAEERLRKLIRERSRGRSR